MEAVAESRLPVAMRLPRREVEVVDAYARENGLTKTDAFLHFLRRGIESERSDGYGARLDSIEGLLTELLQKVDTVTPPTVAEISQVVSREAAKFPAIRKVILFGSFARGEAARESDIDLRLEIDRSGTFSLYDLARFQKAVNRATSREVDALTADTVKNENLAAAIAREGVTVYEREGDQGEVKAEEAGIRALFEMRRAYSESLGGTALESAALAEFDAKENKIREFLGRNE